MNSARTRTSRQTQHRWPSCWAIPPHSPSIGATPVLMPPNRYWPSIVTFSVAIRLWRLAAGRLRNDAAPVGGIACGKKILLKGLRRVDKHAHSLLRHIHVAGHERVCIHQLFDIDQFGPQHHVTAGECTKALARHRPGVPSSPPLSPRRAPPGSSWTKCAGSSISSSWQ